MRRGRRLAALAALVGVGCSFTPKYRRPPPPVAERWPGATDAAPAGGRAAADVGWRDVFGDARIQALVALALKENRDLRIAALNVELARATHQIERSALLPTIGASAGADVGGGLDGDIATRYTVGIGVTAFELDLFGRIRSLQAAALEEYLATDAARRSVHLSLVAEVAAQALVVQALTEQRALAERTLGVAEGSLEITRRLLAAGQRSDLDVASAEAQVEAARAEVARLGRLRAQAEHTLVLLVGHPLPSGLPEGRPLEDARLLADLPAGLPSAALLRRPDVLAAEHALRAANHDIGAARAAYFPTISLTAFGGLVSEALASLFTGGAAAWAVSPQASLPLFDGGRRSANLDAAHVRKQIEVARYERTIQQAFREVADALTARGALEEQLAAQTRRVAAEERRYALSEVRYRAGVESYLSVLTAQRDLYAAQQQLIDVRLARLSNLVELYKALGGGWVERSATR